MADQTQTFASHRRWIPLWHFFALPVLIINVFVVAISYVRDPRPINAWGGSRASATSSSGRTARS